jgi:hypothetical protein
VSPVGEVEIEVGRIPCGEKYAKSPRKLRNLIAKNLENVLHSMSLTFIQRINYDDHRGVT